MNLFPLRRSRCMAFHSELNRVEKQIEFYFVFFYLEKIFSFFYLAPLNCVFLWWADALQVFGFFFFQLDSHCFIIVHFYGFMNSNKINSNDSFAVLFQNHLSLGRKFVLNIQILNTGRSWKYSMERQRVSKCCFLYSSFLFHPCVLL